MSDGFHTKYLRHSNREYLLNYYRKIGVGPWEKSRSKKVKKFTGMRYEGYWVEGFIKRIANLSLKEY